MSLGDTPNRETDVDHWFCLRVPAALGRISLRVVPQRFAKSVHLMECLSPLLDEGSPENDSDLTCNILALWPWPAWAEMP